MSIFKGHPRGLMALFFAEMWERYGFYGILALFIFYLSDGPMNAHHVYGDYMGAVYFTPLFGGFLARKVGTYRCMVMGAVVLAVGYFMLATVEQRWIYWCIAVLALGNGLFKSNVSDMVGALYSSSEKAKQDSGYAIFYTGINLGAMFAPITMALVKDAYGYHTAFATCGVAMLVSAAALVLGRKQVEKDVLSAQMTEASDSALLSFADGMVVRYMSARPDSSNWQKVACILAVCVLAGVFFFAFHQNGDALMLWARDNVEREVSVGWRTYTIPYEWPSAANSIFVVLIGIPLAMLIGGKRKDGTPKLTAARKMQVGLFLTAASYAGLGLVAHLYPSHAPMLYLIGFYLSVSAAEIFVSPMGLSMVRSLSPAGWAGVLLGAWFLSISIGNRYAGKIGDSWNSWGHDHFFYVLALIVAGAASTMSIFIGVLNKHLQPKRNH